MKKYLLSVLLMLSVSAMFAQDFGKNRFGVGLGYSALKVKDVDGSHAGFSSPIFYERIFGESGNLGLKVGMNMNFTSVTDDVAMAVYAFDVALNWYIMGQAKGIYVAPTFKIGSAILANTDGDTSDSQPYTSIGVNTGYQIQITKLFGINPNLGYDLVKFGESDFGDVGVFRVGVGFNFSF